MRTCEKIISMLDKDELTFKTSASLMLGICKVFNKQVKLYLDDLVQTKSLEEKEPKSKHKKMKMELDSTKISISKDGLFSILKERENKTPQKLVDNKMIETPSSIEMFRAMPSTNNDKMMKAEIADSSGVDNFLQFISENVNENFPDMEGNLDLKMDFTYSDIGKQLKFSDTKSLLDNFKLTNELSGLKEKKIKKAMPKIDYDRKIQTTMETIHADSDEENEEDVEVDLMKRFKEKIKLLVNPFPDINTKEISNEDELILNELSTNFSILDVKDFSEFTDLNEKLNKLAEEEKAVIEPIPEVHENEDYQNNVYEPEDLNPDNISYTLVEKLRDSLKNNMKLNAINKKLKEYPKPDIFYNLLCMAQNGEIQMSQKEMFKDVILAKD
jgi:hypothetical protein